jgi:hypothetical protein
MAMNPKAKLVLDRYQSLNTQRQTWEEHWQEVADYMMPRKADITKKRSKGDKRHELIFDGTAIHSLELLSASLHGMLTNIASPFFYLRYRNTDLDKDDEAKEWLESCTDVMYKVFSASNFQQEIFELYHDLISFGTAAMLIEEDVNDDLRFRTIYIAEIFITEDERGMVDSLLRKFYLPARTVSLKFGEQNLPKNLKDKAKSYPYEEVPILHLVMPNEEFKIAKGNKGKPYYSVYVDPDSGAVLKEGGYEEFPYVVPRYLKASNEIYGRSPAMNALADVKMLNTMSKTTIRAAQKQIDPPLLVPDDGFLLPIRTIPGGLNYYRAGTRDKIEPMNIGANNPLGLNMEEQRRKAIRENFFVDQLMTSTGPQMTATEVLQRTEEKMRLLGPVLGRLQSELLQPLITRAFNILLRNKKFPQPPEFLGNQDIEIEYVSPLAKAQKTSELSSIMRGVEIFGSLQNMAPVFDHIDIDGLVKYIQDILGIPAKVMKSDAQVQQIRLQREQMQQQQMEMQQQMQVAEAAGKAAPALKAINE